MTSSLLALHFSYIIFNIQQSKHSTGHSGAGPDEISAKEISSRWNKGNKDSIGQVGQAGQAKVIGDRILDMERQRKFELSRSDRFRYRTRHFYIYFQTGFAGSSGVFYLSLFARQRNFNL